MQFARRKVLFEEVLAERNTGDERGYMISRNALLESDSPFGYNN